MQGVLAAIIWVALYGMFSQVIDVWKYFKVSVWDMVRYYVYKCIHVAIVHEMHCCKSCNNTCSLSSTTNPKM